VERKKSITKQETRQKLKLDAEKAVGTADLRPQKVWLDDA
jgi:hypothetical protein